MSTSEIAVLLRQDGYRALAGRASEIREAARHGCLLWTAAQLTTTDASAIAARPECDEEDT